MNAQDILNLIKEDKWMMQILRIAESVNLKNWVIGGGFVRNKVWDHLHGYSNSQVDTNDIDLAYFDPDENNQEADEELSKQLKDQTGINWEITNQIYTHKWNDLPPYKSIEDALYQWPETATGIGVKLENENLILVAPHGINDLVNLIVRPSPNFLGRLEKVEERANEREWFKKWPRLKFIKT